MGVGVSVQLPGGKVAPVEKVRRVVCIAMRREVAAIIIIAIATRKPQRSQATFCFSL